MPTSHFESSPMDSFTRLRRLFERFYDLPADPKDTTERTETKNCQAKTVSQSDSTFRPGAKA